jgi:hypothetical protein
VLSDNKFGVSLPATTQRHGRLLGKAHCTRRGITTGLGW